ncbi:arsenic resistance N-acetyltransferase ArsN2 [Natrarchaeobius sp. A-rgal3]|uniref:arsenic resistance N-acetyltransferase ArsN2 n=1 Tax=Natrarchaeobius versutus TaxID=1679078 RepID=UPI00350EF865
MSDSSLTLHSVDDRTLPSVEALLEANDLPSADVREKPDSFYVARREGDRVGIGGIETRGADGLLRSVVVERPARGNGLGAALCTALEAQARADGVETLYLLTTTASEFFAARGYGVVDRNDAPATIRDTAEFTELCPATATCMRKSL